MPAEQPLFVLAYDHRSVLRDLVARWTSDEVPADHLRATKDIVLDALLQSIAQHSELGRDQFGLLVDEEYGAAAAGRAHEERVQLIMPIERSGAPTFTLDFGDRWVEHLNAFPVDFAKALVFVNPDREADAYEQQLTRLAQALGTVHEQGHRVMLEVVVPATDEQLAAADGDPDMYDREIRPSLMCRVVDDCYRLGMRPDLWKLEGLDKHADAGMVAAAVRNHDPQSAVIVLGRGADGERVGHWLRVAAATPGFAGFAIGRTIWEDALRRWLLGSSSPEQAVRQIAAVFSGFVDTYRAAMPAVR